ncbi:MAG: DUF805 domain-containing protein [Proteobacteria bacterium]|nr:DUF805 domain-containing protein [Pseudomonadota bacterium]
MNFPDAIRTCFTKYAEFDGRASRPEFWWWVLFIVLASALGDALWHRLSWAVSLVTLVPTIAVTTRRLHDIDRSGWWQLVGLIPFVGWIVIVVWCVQKPVEPNRYG